MAPSAPCVAEGSEKLYLGPEVVLADLPAAMPPPSSSSTGRRWLLLPFFWGLPRLSSSNICCRVWNLHGRRAKYCLGSQSAHLHDDKVLQTSSRLIAKPFSWPFATQAAVLIMHCRCCQHLHPSHILCLTSGCSDHPLSTYRMRKFTPAIGTVQETPHPTMGHQTCGRITFDSMIGQAVHGKACRLQQHKRHEDRHTADTCS